MNAKRRQSGLTLTEMAVVVGVTALLAGLALPAVRMVMESFESGDSAASMISSALAAARGLAAREGHYVGVRFQKVYNRDAIDPLNPLKASQYMIFIIHDSSILASGYRVLEGTKPIKLPDSIGVMDWRIVANRSDSGSYNEIPIEDPVLGGDASINDDFELTDTTTFSVVFSPTGKLVTRRVQVRNRDGIPDTIARVGNISSDDVFNKKSQVDAEVAMFYQDDYYGVLNTPAYPDVPAKPNLGLGPEYSRSRFLIYNRTEFKSAYKAGTAWSGYLVNLTGEMTYINPNTGTIISRK
jgi:type II secretory pathway pseudopilin PulG